MAKLSSKNEFLNSLSSLFYISKFLGVVPHSFYSYYKNKILKTSFLGNIWILIVTIGLTTLYHFSTYLYTLSNSSNTSSLTIAIGVLITYMEPAMMIVEQFLAILNRNRFITLFERFRIIDTQLAKEGIIIENNKLRRKLNIILIIASTFFWLLIALNIFYFHNTFDLKSLTIIFTAFPLMISILGKIWFVTFMLGIYQRFYAINEYLSKVSDLYLAQNAFDESKVDIDTYKGYLEEEIGGKKNFKKNYEFFKKNNKVTIDISPKEREKTNKIGFSGVINIAKIETQLTTICNIHNQICCICNTLNSMWTVQLLLMMAYSFMSITAQFYFLYCGLVSQEVPELFESAQSLLISTVYIICTALRSVYVIYISWQTKLESKRSGVCIHKIANSHDNNEIYEIVNHLSLKLLSRSFSFNACGFFELDMKTIYSVAGAITSYLIILIQFNIAAHPAFNSSNQTINATLTDEL